jgi:heat shock protein HslJ
MRCLTAAALVLALSGNGMAQSLLTGPNGLQGSWRVIELNGQPVGTDTKASLTFGIEAISGKSFCNRYTAKADIYPYRMYFGAIASTRMACASTLMEKERLFLDILGRTVSALIWDGTVTLNAEDGRTIRFRPM